MLFELLVLTLEIPNQSHVVAQMGFTAEDVSGDIIADIAGSICVEESVIWLFSGPRKGGKASQHSCSTVSTQSFFEETSQFALPVGDVCSVAFSQNLNAVT